MKTLLALAAAAVLASAAPAATPPDISGVWLVRSPPGALKTLEGRDPPLAAGVSRAAPPDPDRGCLPLGPLRAMYAPYPVKILSRPGQVTLMHEYNHLVRFIPLDKPPPADSPYNWMGASAGRWEGDTLVVETFGLNGETWLDGSGLPASPEFRMTERLRLTDGGRRLEDVVTVTDPKVFARPWTTRVSFDRRPDLRLEESVCKVSARKLPIPPARR